MIESERPPHDPEKGEECDCFNCHIGTVGVGLPRDFSSRSRSKGKPRGNMNSYENGIPTTSRPGGFEMPYLRKDGEVMRVKEVNSKRHQIRENEIRAKSVPISPPTT